MTRRLEFRSDNAAGVAPEIMAAVVAANSGSALAYGADPWTEQLRERVAEVFEFPEVAVFPVSSGTAANALGLSALCPPWGAVLCHDSAHIVRSEGGATSLFGGGAVMVGLPGEGSKVAPAAVQAALDATNWGDPHHSQPSVLSLTVPTDRGALYRPAEVDALATVAASKGLRTHIDGARLANVVAALSCSPADLTWRAGVSMLSLGATKNGAMSTDAIICFDPEAAEQLVYRTKRAGQVASKMRFQSVQLDAYLTDGLWLSLASVANAAMARLAAGLVGLGLELVVPPEVNMVFVRVADPVAVAVQTAGLDCYRMGPGVIRLVTSFQTTDADIDLALQLLADALEVAHK
ncbi:MAG: threonine aldolase family protein [Acidimicrobiales bacterium]